VSLWFLPSDNLSLFVGWSFFCEMLMDCGSRDRDSSGNPFAWEMRQIDDKSWKAKDCSG